MTPVQIIIGVEKAHLRKDWATYDSTRGSSGTRSGAKSKPQYPTRWVARGGTMHSTRSFMSHTALKPHMSTDAGRFMTPGTFHTGLPKVGKLNAPALLSRAGHVLDKMDEQALLSRAGVRAESESEKIARRTDVSPSSGQRKYGNVRYADPKNKEYPLDTERHVRAAWSYINMPKNSGKYPSKDRGTLKSRIRGAMQRIGARTEKGHMQIQTLEEFRETLANDADKSAVDRVLALTKGEGIGSGKITDGTNWHQQDSVGDVPGTAHAGVQHPTEMPIDHELIYPESGKAADGGDKEAAKDGKPFGDQNDNDADDKSAAADGEVDKAKGQSGSAANLDGDSAMGKEASAADNLRHGMGQADHCAKALAALCKSQGDNEMAKSALAHFNSMYSSLRAFHKAYIAQDKIAKTVSNEYDLTALQDRFEQIEANQDEISKALGRFAARVDNEFGELSKYLDGLPASRHAAPGNGASVIAVPRDERDASPAMKATIASRRAQGWGNR